MKSILAESKIVFAALTFSIVSFCFTGCQKEESTSFTATTQSYQAPKLHITSNCAYWDNGDQVDINDGTYSVSVDGSSNNKATIDGVTAYGGEYYAAYPASYADIATNGTIVFDLPSKEAYTTTASGNQNTHNLMVAKANNSHLAFQNVGAMLHFQLKGSESGIGQKLVAIEVSTDKPLYGKLTVTPSGSNWSTSLSSTASDTARILTFSNHTITNTAEDFYIFIPEVINATHFRLQYVIESDNTVKVFDAIKFASTDFLKEHIYHFGENEYNGNKIKISDTRDIYPLDMDGTQANPYLISSNTLWQASSSHLAHANNYVTLVNDISVDTRITTLKAHLNGNGHTITLNSNSISLFENIDGGSVSNLTIEGNITAPAYSNLKYGTLACTISNGAMVENCINKADITCLPGHTYSTPMVGGLCAQASTTCIIRNCSNEGQITSNAMYTGGIIGYSNIGIVELSNCTNYGEITVPIASSEYSPIHVGGIAGYISISVTSENSYTITNLQNHGDISISGETSNTFNCGGLFGYLSAPGTASLILEDCFNKGNITYNSTISNGAKYFGGLIAYDGNCPSLMINCFNEGNINCSVTTNNTIAGGLLGKDNKMSFTNCYAFCNIKAYKVAGLVAEGETLLIESKINNCYYHGTITASISKGIAGDSPNSSTHFTLSNCFCPSAYEGNYCGDYGSVTNCSTASTATDATMLESLNNNRPNEDCHRWVSSSSHIIFQNP